MQTVASIEERTRPNLSKTLKGTVQLYVDFQDAALTRKSVSFIPPSGMFSFILHCAVECASLSFYVRYTFLRMLRDGL